MNGMLLSMLEYDDDGELDKTSLIPLIDGGTEGFKGNIFHQYHTFFIFSLVVKYLNVSFIGPPSPPKKLDGLPHLVIGK